MEEQILKLRSEGKTYGQIVNIVGCSKSTVSYYCGKDQKNKTKKRGFLNRNSLINKIKRRVDTFRGRICDNQLFMSKKYNKRDENHIEFVNKILDNPYCYLTGVKLDLNSEKGYEIDHIIPFHLTKDNSIENMGVLSCEINRMKSSLTKEKLIENCISILKHQGYCIKNPPNN